VSRQSSLTESQNCLIDSKYPQLVALHKYHMTLLQSKEVNLKQPAATQQVNWCIICRCGSCEVTQDMCRCLQSIVTANLSGGGYIRLRCRNGNHLSFGYRGMHSSKSRHEGMIFACGTTGTHLSRPWTYEKVSLKEEALLRVTRNLE
jgi:hypothetical protein